MNTKQVEELTGISRQNIRYYERAGLLHPSREKGNAYRDYSMEDVDCLRMIKFLRMLDMPVEEVGKVLTGEFPFEDAIKIQKEKLEEQQKLFRGPLRYAVRLAGKWKRKRISRSFRCRSIYHGWSMNSIKWEDLLNLKMITKKL